MEWVPCHEAMEPLLQHGIERGPIAPAHQHWQANWVEVDNEDAFVDAFLCIGIPDKGRPAPDDAEGGNKCGFGGVGLARRGRSVSGQLSPAVSRGTCHCHGAELADATLVE